MPFLPNERLYFEKKKKGIVSCNALTIMQFDIKLLYLIIARNSKRSEKKQKKKDFSSSCFIKPGITFSFSTERPTFEKQNTKIENCLVQFAGNNAI